jgi:uncharacterized protein (TIGR00730 family)
MSEIRRICVYCGSSPGTDPAYVKAAEEFGRILAEAKIGLVYGGGAIGLMGALAYSVLDHGGEVTGIIPEFLMSREKALRGTHDMIVTHDMHERKRKMFDLADAFVTLPGGVGTLEEVVEQITWMQLGRHKKPILLANINGFWDPLCALFDHMKALDFIHSRANFEVLVTDKISDILPMLRDFAAKVPEEAKWMESTAADRL